MGLGKAEKEVNLEGKCLWVPASVRHESASGNRYAFFTYGGVNLQAKVNYLRQQSDQGTMNPPPERYPAHGGSGGSGSSGGSGGPGRFTQLLSGASKAEAREFLKSGNHNLPADQTAKVLDAIRSGGAGNFY